MIANYINEFMKGFDTDPQGISTHDMVHVNTPYEIIKNLETQLRKYIEDKLSSKTDKWWIQRVPQDVRTNAEIRKQRNEKQWPWYGNEASSIMAYVDFADYLKIITQAENWRGIFKETFYERELISAKFKELNPIRNKIAHSRDLTDQDLGRLRINAEDIILCLVKAQPSSD